MRAEVRAMLVALGDGGTTELAERALAHLEGLVADREAADVRDEMVTPGLELGGLAEVSAALGVSRQTLGHWRSGRRPAPVPFPAPGWELDATPVWNMALIRELQLTSVKDGES